MACLKELSSVCGVGNVWGGGGGRGRVLGVWPCGQNMQKMKPQRPMARRSEPRCKNRGVNL